jgi:hypothetical protein
MGKSGEATHKCTKGSVWCVYLFLSCPRHLCFQSPVAASLSWREIPPSALAFLFFPSLDSVWYTPHTNIVTFYTASLSQDNTTMQCFLFSHITLALLLIAHALAAPLPLQNENENSSRRGNITTTAERGIAEAREMLVAEASHVLYSKGDSIKRRSPSDISYGALEHGDATNLGPRYQRHTVQANPYSRGCSKIEKCRALAIVAQR